MKKSTLFIAVLALCTTQLVWADVELEEGEGTSVGSTPTPKAPPLLLVQALPGMNGRSAYRPFNRLPGMSAPGAQLALPMPLISDLTNYPNPVDTRKPGNEGQTHIVYQLSQDAPVTIEIYDLLGHHVRTWDIASGSNGGRLGANAIVWDGTNSAGQKVSKGGYIAQVLIETPQTTVTVTRKIGVIH